MDLKGISWEGVTFGERARDNFFKKGPEKFWGITKEDRASRKATSDEFAGKWDKLLGLIRNGESIEASVAKGLIPDVSRGYCLAGDGYGHLLFECAGTRYVAQISSARGLRVDQIWTVVNSYEPNPLTLRVTFNSQEDRDRFARAAKAVGREESDLALELLMDFARKFKNDGASEFDGLPSDFSF